MDTLDKALDVLNTYGPFIGPLLVALVFFLWRDHRREDRLTKRINALEDENRTRVDKLDKQHTDVVLPLLRECTQVIAHNTIVMERLERRLDL